MSAIIASTAHQSNPTCLLNLETIEDTGVEYRRILQNMASIFDWLKYEVVEKYQWSCVLGPTLGPSSPNKVFFISTPFGDVYEANIEN